MNIDRLFDTHWPVSKYKNQPLAISRLFQGLITQWVGLARPKTWKKSKNTVRDRTVRGRVAIQVNNRRLGKWLESKHDWRKGRIHHFKVYLAKPHFLWWLRSRVDEARFKQRKTESSRPPPKSSGWKRGGSGCQPFRHRMDSATQRKQCDNTGMSL